MYLPMTHHPMTTKHDMAIGQKKFRLDANNKEDAHIRLSDKLLNEKNEILKDFVQDSRD